MPKTTAAQRARNFRALSSMRARLSAGAACTGSHPLNATPPSISDMPKALPVTTADARFLSVSWPIKTGMSKKHHAAAGASTTACGSTIPDVDGLERGHAGAFDCLRCARQTSLDPLQ